MFRFKSSLSRCILFYRKLLSHSCCSLPCLIATQVSVRLWRSVTFLIHFGANCQFKIPTFSFAILSILIAVTTIQQPFQQYFRKFRRNLHKMLQIRDATEGDQLQCVPSFCWLSFGIILMFLWWYHQFGDSLLPTGPVEGDIVLQNKIKTCFPAACPQS